MPLLAALSEANQSMILSLRAAWRQYRLVKRNLRGDLRPIILKKIRAIRTLREHSAEISHPIYRWKGLAARMHSVPERRA